MVRLPSSQTRTTPPRTLASCLALLALLALSAAGCSDVECGRAICGCWEERTVSVAITVQDEVGAPVEGIELVCLNETQASAVSDEEGLLSRTFETRESPGCGIERCNTLTLSDPSGVCQGLQSTLIAINDSTVRLDCFAEQRR